MVWYSFSFLGAKPSSISNFLRKSFVCLLLARDIELPLRVSVMRNHPAEAGDETACPVFAIYAYVLFKMNAVFDRGEAILSWVSVFGTSGDWLVCAGM